MSDLRDQIARWLKKRSAVTHCPHSRLRGIYGDEINHTPGFRRLQCLDCGTFLDGPVWIADYRKNEYRARYAERDADAVIDAIQAAADAAERGQ